MVIATPMIVYRHGDDVPGERIRKSLVYGDCISQPDRNVENPDNSDLLETQLPEWPRLRSSDLELHANHATVDNNHNFAEPSEDGTDICPCE